MTIRNLDKLLDPASVALIGATERDASLGAAVMDRLLKGGFQGPIGLVNPKYSEINGMPCAASAEALANPPDLGVVVTPPAAVPAAIADLGAAGARAAVVITAGVDEKSGLRQQMLDAAKPHLLRVLGPNCLGLARPKLGLDATFAPIAARPGKLALLSQSGAIVTAMVDWAAERDIGFSVIASMGDMADVDVGDLLDWLAADRETSAVLLYLEQITHARKFMSAARSCSRAKPVIAIKSGRSSVAAQAAVSHTGALAGADEVYDAALRRAGVLRVQALEDLFNAAEALAHTKPLASDRLAIVTNGGGAGVLAADAIADIGARVATLAPETLSKLDAALPANWSRGDPVDIIGDAGPARYAAAVEAVLGDPGVDAVLTMYCPTAMSDPMEAAQIVIDAATTQRAARRGKPLLACWMGGAGARAACLRMEKAGVPAYATPKDAVTGFSHLVNHAKAQAALRRAPSAREDGFVADRTAARRAIEAALEQGRRILTEPEAKTVLKAYGVPTVETIVAETPEQARSAAQKILDSGGEAVVAKILSTDLTHKSDVGGVRLNLSTAEETREAVEAMLTQIKARRPDAAIQGVVIQPMINRSGAHELILGLSEDPVFGPIMLFGAGGTSVEAVADKAIGLPPLDGPLARDMIESTRIFRLLRGYRDQPPADMEAIVACLERLSLLAADFPEIRELDVNPLLADRNGALALDARIVVAPAQPVRPGGNPRFALRPYPAAWESAETFDDGAVLMRPIRPSDGDAYRRFFEKLSGDDVRFRFFSRLGALDDRLLARFTQLDYARAMAFVALDPDSREILGVARLAAEPDGALAEYGVVVRSDCKRRGLGRLLMRRLLAFAASEGLQTVWGDVLHENKAMLGLCAELGFKTSSVAGDAALVRVFKKLSGSEALDPDQGASGAPASD